MCYIKKIIFYIYVPPQSSPCATVLLKLLLPARNTNLDQPFHLTDEKSEIQEAKRFVSGHTISDKVTMHICHWADLKALALNQSGIWSLQVVVL